MRNRSTSCFLLASGYHRSIFFFQAEDGIRDADVTGVQTCALPICMLRPYVACLPSLSLHRQDRHPLDRFAGTLRVEIERTQRLDLLSPPLEPRRGRHPKPIHVEDPAPYAELRHFRDGRDASLTHRLESLDAGCEL